LRSSQRPKKKGWGRRDAEIARFYHINPFTLSAAEYAKLDLNLEAILAVEILGQGGGRTAKSVYDLTLAATGDVEKAAEARAKFIEDLMREDKEVPME
jgi:hypothetical protein